MIKSQKLDKSFEVLEWIFKIGILLYALFSFNSYFYGKRIISLIMWPTLLIGMIIILYKLLNYKIYKTMPGLIFIVLFIISYILSMLVNIKYGFKEGIIKLVFLLMYFFVLFLNKENISREKMKKEINVLGGIFEIYMAVCVCISFFFMFIGYTSVRTIKDGWDIGIGFLWGRLWGIFTEPNYASVCACVAIILCLYFFNMTKNKLWKIVYICNIILQVCYIAFTDSRTGKVSLAVAVTVFVFNALNYKRLHSAKLKKVKIYQIILILALVCVVTYKIPGWITASYNSYMTDFDAQEPQKRVDRGYDLKEDPSNRRFDIWKSGIEIFEKTPVVGTSFTNILAFTKENVKDSYMLNNSMNKNFSSIHNEVLNVMVSQGIIGLLILLGFIVYALNSYVKYYFKENNDEEQIFDNMTVSCLAGVFAQSMFLTGMFYSNSPAVICFWLFFGWFMINMKTKKEQ